MKRNEITQGLIVRVRPTGRTYGHVIGRITTSTVGAKHVGYYGKTATTVSVEWYATLNEDGTVRYWNETRTDGKFDARRLEVIDLDKLAAELHGFHEMREAGRRSEDDRQTQTEAGLEAIRSALGDPNWGSAWSGGEVRLSGRQLDALVALVSKVVAS